MTIILDFDDVLFDTNSFKKSLAAIFKRYGADFYRNYNKAKTPSGVYSLRKHLILAKKENKKIDIKKINQDINKIEFTQFLFPDVIKFLKTFRNQDLILLTWGDKEFQERKIYGLGKEFISLFDKVITVPTEKAEVLDKILKSYKSRPVVFIDNSQKELENIKDKVENIVLIKMTRGGRGLSLHKEHIEAVNLKEVKNFLKSYGV